MADIDSERMLIHVEHGKGAQYRNAMLDVDLLALLAETAAGRTRAGG